MAMLVITRGYIYGYGYIYVVIPIFLWLFIYLMVIYVYRWYIYIYIIHHRLMAIPTQKPQILLISSQHLKKEDEETPKAFNQRKHQRRWTTDSSQDFQHQSGVSNFLVIQYQYHGSFFCGIRIEVREVHEQILGTTVGIQNHQPKGWIQNL